MAAGSNTGVCIEPTRPRTRCPGTHGVLPTISKAALALRRAKPPSSCPGRVKTRRGGTVCSRRRVNTSRDARSGEDPPRTRRGRGARNSAFLPGPRARWPGSRPGHARAVCVSLPRPRSHCFASASLPLTPPRASFLFLVSNTFFTFNLCLPYRGIPRVSTPPPRLSRTDPACQLLSRGGAPVPESFTLRSRPSSRTETARPRGAKRLAQQWREVAIAPRLIRVLQAAPSGGLGAAGNPWIRIVEENPTTWKLRAPSPASIYFLPRRCHEFIYRSLPECLLCASRCFLGVTALGTQPPKAVVTIHGANRASSCGERAR